jgi:hypothetical protein
MFEYVEQVAKILNIKHVEQVFEIRDLCVGIVQVFKQKEA